jgi:nucleoside phosphorylase
MIQALVVEDDADKLKDMCRLLTQIDGFTTTGIKVVGDIHSARHALATTTFDLLVLDIAIPTRPGEPVTLEGGLRLMEEIEGRSRLRTPNHIVGITGYPEVYEKVFERFASRMVTVLYYDPTSDEWSQRLAALARQVAAVNADQLHAPKEYQSEVAIVCALPSPELQSVLRNGWQWEQTHIENDHNIYYKGAYLRDGVERVAYAGAAPQMGMTASAIMAMNMLHSFRPAILAMTGVAAGVRGRVNIGDVAVADPTWDWGNGKLTVGPDGESFEPAPRQLPLAPDLRSKVELMSRDSTVLNQIQADWQGPLPNSRFAMHLGPIASGASVIADPGTGRSILQQNRKLIAIEMEAYGIFAAAEGALEPRPKALVMKSIVDFADSEKDDRFHHYGAYTSAQALRVFLENYYH